MPAKHAQQLKQVYSQIAKSYAERNKTNIDRKILDDFLSKVTPGGKILDLGCGHGRDAEYMVKRGWPVTLFDISPELLAIAQNKIPNAEAIEGDMTEMSFADNFFSGVWAHASLLHLTKNELSEVLNKIYRMLTKPGFLHVSMKLGRGEKLVDEGNKFASRVKRYFKFYQPEELIGMLHQVGFEIVAKKLTHHPPSVNNWIQILAIKK